MSKRGAFGGHGALSRRELHARASNIAAGPACPVCGEYHPLLVHDGRWLVRAPVKDNTTEATNE